MICAHPLQPLTYLHDGHVLRFHECAACAAEWRRTNGVVRTEFALDQVRWAVDEAEVKHRMEKRNEGKD